MLPACASTPKQKRYFSTRHRFINKQRITCNKPCLHFLLKKAAQNLLNRELEPWETIAVGALSGGLAAVVTTPFDVMKTRTMTAPQGVPVSMEMIAFSILRQEGPLGLFKGAVPRFFWIAPLGAMNFAGYELARKAMDKSEAASADQFQEKRTTTSR